MKCALYSRVSTNRQENENQLRELREFAAKQNWEVVNEFVDVVSGSGKKFRPRFEEMLKAASQRKFDVLLFWKLDRFSREGVRRTLQYLTQLDAWGVKWRSYTDQYLDSTGIFKDAIISILATLAEQERLVIGERTRAGLARAKRQGKTLGRPEGSFSVKLKLSDIQKLQREGLGLRDIAKRLGCSVNTVQARIHA
jgi:DNA invertase Pin-like site-specific DNA recombinase